jgi:hypothetical protein
VKAISNKPGVQYFQKPKSFHLFLTVYFIVLTKQFSLLLKYGMAEKMGM